MKTAFILTRYSTDHQNPDTTAVQVKCCSEYCVSHQLSVIGIFSDEAVSGMKQHRPEYDRMIDLYRSGAGADVVVIYDQSRMFRDMVEWFQFRKALEIFGASVVSVTQPLLGGDLLDPAVFINEGAMALFNQMHVLVTRQKVKEKMRWMAAQGKAPGGKPPLGYDLDADRHYIINEYEADTVRKIFSMHADGASYGQIIETLKLEGRLTKAGRPFGKNSLHEVLKNEKYIGVLVYGAVPSHSPTGKRNNHRKPPKDVLRIENAVPRIIDDETWEAVAERMRSRQKVGGRYSAKFEYLLSGKVFCGKCGGAMIVSGSNQGAEGQKYRYYNCCNKRQTRTCDSKGISVVILEQKVACAVKEQLTGSDGLQQIITVAMQYRDEFARTAAPRAAEIQLELSAVDGKIRNLVNAVANGLANASIAGELTALEQMKAELLAAQKALASSAAQIGLSDAEIREALGQLANADPAERDGMRALLSIVSKVRVHADHIDIYTILGPDGQRPSGRKAVEDLISTGGAGFLAPNVKNPGQ